MAYYDNVNPTLLELVDPSARRFCELGCGAGALARAVRDKCNDVAFYAGVDIDAASIRAADGALDAALVRNLDQVPDWSLDADMARHLAPETFDCVLMGDVLEHLVDPLRCLTQAARLLKPQGRLLACIPNVQHWSVFVQLVHGSWPRAEAGLFDRTHLRWFALDDMVALFRDAGLNVLSVTPRIFDAERGQEVMEFLEPLAQHLGLDAEQAMARGLPLQYVLCGERVAAA